MILKPGDIVCTTYSMEHDPDGPDLAQQVLSLGIRTGQCINDVDGMAIYTHTFIITDESGRTFETLWTYRSQRIGRAYAGQQVLIGRHKNMAIEKFYIAHEALHKKYAGRRYPAWKIPLFLLAPRLIKYLPGKPVCSELTFRYLYRCGLVDHWRGVTPSYVADAIRRWRDFEIIYEGRLTWKQLLDGS